MWERVVSEDQMIPNANALKLHWQRCCWVYSLIQRVLPKTLKIGVEHWGCLCNFDTYNPVHNNHPFFSPVCHFDVCSYTGLYSSNNKTLPQCSTPIFSLWKNPLNSRFVMRILKVIWGRRTLTQRI
jgi:hypothetical protein